MPQEREIIVIEDEDFEEASDQLALEEEEEEEPYVIEDDEDDDNYETYVIEEDVDEMLVQQDSQTVSKDEGELVFPHFLLNKHKQLSFIVELEQTFQDLLADTKRNSRLFKGLPSISRKIVHHYAHFFNFEVKQADQTSGKNRKDKTLKIVRTAKSAKPSVFLSEVLARNKMKGRMGVEHSASEMESRIVHQMEDLITLLHNCEKDDFADLYFLRMAEVIQRLKKKLTKFQDHMSDVLNTQSKPQSKQSKQPRQPKQSKQSKQPTQSKSKQKQKENKSSTVQFVVGGAIAEDGHYFTPANTLDLQQSLVHQENEAITRAPELSENEEQEHRTVEFAKTSEFPDREESTEEEERQDSEEERDGKQKHTTGISADRDFARFLDTNTPVGNNVMKMMEKMGFNFDNPHGLGKEQKGIVNPVRLEKKNKTVYNLVSDFSLKPSSNSSNQSARPLPARPLYEMKPRVELGEPNVVNHNRVQQQREQKKDGKSSSGSDNKEQGPQEQSYKKYNKKERQHEKQQKKKKIEDFIATQLRNFYL